MPLAHPTPFSLQLYWEFIFFALIIFWSIREEENCWREGAPVGSEFLAKVKSFTPSSRHMAALSGPSVCLYLCFSPTPPRPRPPSQPPHTSSHPPLCRWLLLPAPQAGRRPGLFHPAAATGGIVHMQHHHHCRRHAHMRTVARLLTHNVSICWQRGSCTRKHNQ